MNLPDIECRLFAELPALLSAQPDPRRFASQTVTNHQIDDVRRMLGEHVPQRDPQELHAALITLGFCPLGPGLPIQRSKAMRTDAAESIRSRPNPARTPPTDDSDTNLLPFQN